jgi:hypothetical protein
MIVKCCFLIDATASMAPWLHAAKTQTRKIRQEILRETPGVTLLLAAVLYRDLEEAPENRFVVIPFTDDIEQFENRIQDVEAFGGGDECEDVAGGFEQVLSLDWRNAEVRSLFHICDAPPHGEDWHDPDVSDDYPDNDFHLGQLVRHVAEDNIQYTIIKATPMLTTMIRRFHFIFRDLGRRITVVDLEGQAPDRTLRRSLLGEDPMHAFAGRILSRTVSSQVTQSIRGEDPDYSHQ